MTNQNNKGSKKLLNAWAFYDWANSVHSLVITSTIFPIFYGSIFRLAGIEKVTIFGGAIARIPLISYVTSIAFVCIAIIIPILSGIADYKGNKKTFLKFFCYLGALSCIGLYWFSIEQIYFSLACYFLGLIGFWVSFALNNSYLPDIAFPHQHDSISAKGFSLGYIGSVILLIINLLMVMKCDWFGITETPEEPASVIAMRYSFVSVGIWWIIFSQYSFYHLPKGNKNESKKRNKNILFNGFEQLLQTWKELKKTKRLKKFLSAFFIYCMAVQTIMLIATFFGEKEIQWEGDTERTMGLITSILVIQLVAILGASITAKASKQFGNISTLLFINVIWVGICIYAFFIITPNEFYIAAGLVGLVMGAIQTLSRSTYSKFLPNTSNTTSFFSFYDVTEKISIVIGTFIYGWFSQQTGSVRVSVLLLGLFFVLGIWLLLQVPKEEIKN